MALWQSCAEDNRKGRKALFNDPIAETRPLLGVGSKRIEVGGKEHVIKALLYAAQTFYAFMIM